MANDTSTIRRNDDTLTSPPECNIQSRPTKRSLHYFGFSPRDNIVDLIADKVVDAIRENSKAPVEQALEEHLPTDSEGVRNLPFYNATLEALRYQRDNYLVGTTYAKRSEKQRQGRLFPSPRLFPRMPRDATALGYVQLTQLGSWFVPSTTIKEALMPIVISLPSGALKDTITVSVANAIPLAQPSLDNAVKNAILNFIDSPQMRQMVKNRTEKILQVNDK
ncbi:hypothetical protein IV203_021241 [Nitzschia inconspicua]|uniref:Uncharacterized protein n=1 Tax=Nitzschia inconspicua TaxID=303405 RepID=A0A9K3KH80_9STRA|nr:hypothetical protein IV203_021241 [Nitzschia inconspicua]